MKKLIGICLLLVGCASNPPVSEPLTKADLVLLIGHFCIAASHGSDSNYSDCLTFFNSEIKNGSRTLEP